MSSIVVNRNTDTEFATPERTNDWESVYQILGEKIFGTPAVADSWIPMNTFLREKRTFWMGGGRQNGKTAWALTKLRENKHTILIARDRSLRDSMVQTMTELRSGETITITLDGDDKDPVGTVKNIMDEVEILRRPRIFTVTDLTAYLKVISEDNSKYIPIKRIIIDDASHNNKLGELFQLLGSLADPDLQIIAIA